MSDATAADSAAVVGELVDDQVAAVVPSAAQQNADADRARGRTWMQVGTPGAIVTILAWIARLIGWDMNGPLIDGDEIPADVVAAFVVVVTGLMAVRMNPKTK